MKPEPLEFSTILWKKIVKNQQERYRIERIGDPEMEPNLLCLSQSIDDFFVYHKLRLYCAYLSYSKLVHPEFISYTAEQLSLVKEAIQLIEQKKVNLPIIKVYNQIRILYEHLSPSDASYNTIFRETLSQVKKLLPALTQKDGIEILSFFTNYCIQGMNKGKKGYDKYFFEISNELLTIKYGGEKTYRNKLPGQFFKNMITTAVHLEMKSEFIACKIPTHSSKENENELKNGFEWALHFCEVYKNKMSKKDQKIHLPYNLAYIEFSRGNYISAYKKIGSPKYIRGTFTNTSYKVLYHKILYELFDTKSSLLEKDHIDLEKAIASFRSTILYEKRIKKLLGYQISYYQEFNTLFRQLYQLRSRYYNFHLQDNLHFIKKSNKLQSAIDNCKYSYKNWFADKLLKLKRN